MKKILIILVLIELLCSCLSINPDKNTITDEVIYVNTHDYLWYTTVDEFHVLDTVDTKFFLMVLEGSEIKDMEAYKKQCVYESKPEDVLVEKDDHFYIFKTFYNELEEKNKAFTELSGWIDGKSVTLNHDIPVEEFNIDDTKKYQKFLYRCFLEYDRLLEQVDITE